MRHKLLKNNNLTMKLDTKPSQINKTAHGLLEGYLFLLLIL